MKNPLHFPPESSRSAGPDDPVWKQRGEKAEQHIQPARQQVGGAPQQNREAVQYGVEPALPGQQYSQNAGFGPPPPPPRRYNVWGMDYSPYDQGGPFAEKTQAVVPQYQQKSQNAEYSPPPPPPKRYNVWGMDYSPYDHDGSASQQDHQGGLHPDLSSAPPPPQEAYNTCRKHDQQYHPGGNDSSRQGDHGGHDNRR